MKGAKEMRVFYRWCAVRAVSRNGNLLRFIGAFFIALALCSALLCTFDLICILAVGTFTLPLILAELFLLFLLVAPLIMGLRRMAFLMARDMENEISDILYFFSGKRLRDAYVILLSGLCGRGALLSAAYFEAGELGAAGRMTKGKTFASIKEGFIYEISFLPLWLLSVPSLGILFFICFLPRYMIGRQAMSACLLGCFDTENLRK